MSQTSKATHGGKRANAGRKSAYTEKTMVMRVPESKVMAIKEWLKPIPEDDRQSTLQLNSIHLHTELKIPYPVAADSSPAQDDAENYIDLNQHLVKNPATTFVLQANSLSMKYAGIDQGDQILIDRSLNAAHGDIVLALVNNEFTIKRFMQEKYAKHGFKVWLKTENPDYPDIYPRSEEEIIIFGVVTCILKKLK